uniref:C-type lectin domain-containing protein n=1 Tax=Gouania willdenowi TaxID=441366 RepID=A0A8C5DXR2_GOUWI
MRRSACIKNADCGIIGLLFSTVFKHELIMVSNKKLNWTEAQTFCRFHYQDLASILDSNTNQLVEDMTSDENDFWIGLFNKDLKWRWSLLDPQRQQTYRHWNKTQANEKEGDQNCVTMNDDGFWSTEQCLKTEKAFVCSHSEC